MIHKSTTSSNVTIVNPTEVEVITPKPVLIRSYSRKTLFQGNGRTLLWEGLGEDVNEANSAYEVCKLAGLDYMVETEPIYTGDGMKIPNMVCTRRHDIEDEVDTPSTVFGVVSNRYTPIQNHEGFDFIDTLFGHHGFQVETAGQFNDGKIVWVEAKLPEKVMVGETIMPYLVFTNRHDGQGSIKIFLTPVRVICKNTLNYAIRGAQGRNFSVTHTASSVKKLEQAKETIENYHLYLDAMEKQIEKQKQCLLEDRHVDSFLNKLFRFKENATEREKAKVIQNREEVRAIYNTAEDLSGRERSGFRFVNAVSDWATHNTSHRNTANYRSNLFQKTLNGNEYIDTAVNMVDEFMSVSNKLVAM